MKRQVIALLIVAVFVTWGVAFAQDRPAISATVTPTTATVGDVLTYTATITWPEGLSVLPPDPAETMESFQVLDKQVSDLALENGIYTLVTTMKIAGYKTGEQTFSPLVVRYTDQAGEQEQESGPEITVNILRIVPEDMDQIKGIKGQKNLPPDLVKPLLIAAGVFLALLVLYLILSRIRKRKRKALARVIEKPEPYSHAVGRLSAGVLDRYLENGQVDDFYVELTDILREYLEGRFEIFALEQTTTEIARSLKGAPIDGFLKTDLSKLLDRADMVKFAGLIPDIPDCSEDLNKGRNFVEKTRPAPPEQQPQNKKTGEGEK